MSIMGVLFEKLSGGRSRLSVQLIEIDTGVRCHRVHSSICSLDYNGRMVIAPGFQWDMPESAFIDDDVIAVPSAVRACILRLIKMKILLKEERHTANRYYRRMLAKGGVPWWKRCLHLTDIEPHTYLASVCMRAARGRL